MHAYRMTAAALFLAVTACSDSVSAPALEIGADLSPNLELSLPKLRPLASVPVDSSRNLARSTDVSRFRPSAFYSDDDFDSDSEIPIEYKNAAFRSLITRLDVDVGFIPEERVAFAQVIGESMGSFYKNHVVLKIRYGNSQVGQNEATESESCLCAHLLVPWGRTANTTVPITGVCGHNASATGTHDARLEFLTKALKLLRLTDDVGTTTGSAFQPACAPEQDNGGGGGGGGTEEDDQWYLCYWEDYYDITGEFIRRKELGCVPIGEL